MQLVYDVALRLSSILTVEQLLWEVVRLIQNAFNYYYVHVRTIDAKEEIAVFRAGWGPDGPRYGGSLRVRDQGVVGWVAWSGEPLLVDDVSLERRYYFSEHFPSTRSEVAVPIKRGDRTIGVLDAQDVRTGAFAKDDVALLETLARQISIAIENAVLFEELTRSRAELQQKARDLDEFVERAARRQEDDRRRIALDLHDGVAQLLVGARFELETVRMSRPPLPDSVIEQLGTVCGVLESCADEMRRVIFDLHPPGLEDLGLVPTLQRYVATFRRLSGLDCELGISGRPFRLAVEVELAIYRIVQESLANVLKHAPGAIPRVSLSFSPMELQVAVRDDGPGFDGDHLVRDRPCFGLDSMRQKADRIGARLSIVSAQGEGTTVALVVPLVGQVGPEGASCG